MKSVYPPLVLCSAISTFLPLFASATRIGHVTKCSTGLVFLWLFFVFAVAAEIILYIFSWHGNQSAWIFHVYTVIEYTLATIVLAGWQIDSKLSKLMRSSIPIFFFCFILIKAVGLENFEPGLHNNITRPLAVLLLSASALLTMQNLWRETPENLAKDYRFWMLLAMAFYYSTSLVLFAFMFTMQLEMLDALFKMHAVTNIIHNILFTVGVFQFTRSPE
ncbi:MAG: hypothetical protein ACREOO_21290 [bacterium]